MRTPPKHLISDAVASFLLFMLALATRLPNAMHIPAYTDEGQDGMWALDIALGRHLPLSGIDGYIGPFFHYVLAAAFRIFGTSVALPRMVSVICGALLVPATYWLGSVVWNRTAGLIAAALALTSPILVVMHSHYAWPGAWLPLFTTATLASVHSGITSHRVWLLALGGLLAALSVQLHPTTIVMIAGLGVWIVSSVRTRVWLKRPALYVAAGLFVVGYAPMIVANAHVGNRLFADAQQRTYAFGVARDLREYVLRIGSFAKVMAGAIVGSMPPATLAARLVEAAMAFATLAGLVFLWRAQNRLIPLLFVATLGILPVFVHGPGTRYFIFLVPAAYVAIGVVAAEGLTRIGHEGIERLRARPAWRRPALACASLWLILLVVWPLVTIRRYYEYVWAAGQTNEPYYQLLRVLHEERACGPRLVLEQVPVPQEPFAPPNFVMNSVEYLLSMDRCVHISVPTAPDDMFTSGTGRWLVRAQGRPTTAIDAGPVPALTTSNVPMFSTFVPVSIYRSGDRR
jgi:4-amino-4-deoxy-L-arabinose transferase-like glycosyltransferase